MNIHGNWFVCTFLLNHRFHDIENKVTFVKKKDRKLGRNRNRQSKRIYIYNVYFIHVYDI